MSDKTSIEWTDATWNPVRGCSVVSEGCRNCYAMQVAARFSGKGQAYESLAYRNESGAHWTGKVKLIEEHLEDPLRWKRPRQIFVNSMSDLFHESLSDTQIQNVFNVMESARQHVYQVLTKRPQRMLEFVKKFDDWLKYASDYPGHLSFKKRFSHVWLGVSCEDQKTADERIPILIETPAAVRWISAEPLLGPLSLNRWMGPFEISRDDEGNDLGSAQGGSDLDWVVVGGESGPGARPMHPQWARSLRDQCAAAGVPYFFKQWGEHLCVEDRFSEGVRWVSDNSLYEELAMDRNVKLNNRTFAYRVGKKAAGRLLDGREWNQYPQTTTTIMRNQPND